MMEPSEEPLYVQIKKVIRQQIESGELLPGNRLPAEPELQKMFNVSRFTVRQAVDGLIQDGLVRRVRGKGTFVSIPKISEELPRLVSFSEEMRKLGKEPSTSYQHVEVVASPHYVREALRLKEDERVVRIERVRCGDGVPIGLLVSYLPEDIGIGPDEDYSNSLWDVLEQKANVNFFKAEQIIEAAMADDHQSRLLDISRRSPLLVIRRTAYDSMGLPIEYVEGFYPADRYSYSISLYRD